MSTFAFYAPFRLAILIGVRMHDAYRRSYEILLSLIFKRSAWLTYTARPRRNWWLGKVPCYVFGALVVSLSIFEAMESPEYAQDVQDEDRVHLKDTLAFFTSFIELADAKADYKTALLLMQAAQQKSSGAPYQAVVDAYDDVIDMASTLHLHLIQALASETVAIYILRKYPKRQHMASGYLLNALHTYGNWGAHSKCVSLVREFPHLAFSPPSMVSLPSSASSTLLPQETALQNDKCTSSDASGLDRSVDQQLSQSSRSGSKKSAALDVASILAAADSWQMEDSIDRMVASILRVLLQNTGSTYGCIAIKDERGLRLRAAGSAEDLKVIA